MNLNVSNSGIFNYVKFFEYVLFLIFYFLLFYAQNYYYFAIVEDLVLRFGWTLSVSLTEMGLIHADIMSSVLAPLEVIRYFIRIHKIFWKILIDLSYHSRSPFIMTLDSISRMEALVWYNVVNALKLTLLMSYYPQI